MANRLMIIPGESEDLRVLPSQISGEFDVQVLDNANDALWEVRTTPPDVIIANVDLPGMSGLDLAEILPNFGVVTRVVLWAAEANPQIAQQAANFGVYRFLVAPTTAADLRAAIDAALRDAHAAAAAEEAEPEPEPVVEEAAPVQPPPERSRRMHDVPAAPTPPERSRRMHDVAPAPVPPERSRRMHDVAPAPPERERTRKPHDVSPAPSLAERARRVAQQEQPTPPEPTSNKPSHTRAGALVLTADNLKPIRSRMESLEREVGSQCIMLADRAGMLLAECGITSGLPTMILLPLLSTSFSTAGQISQMLREKDASALYVHEGVNYDVYCFDVLQSYMLVIIFSKSAGSQVAKIGSVWVYAKRAIRDMEEMLG